MNKLTLLTGNIKINITRRITSQCSFDPLLCVFVYKSGILMHSSLEYVCVDIENNAETHATDVELSGFASFEHYGKASF